MGERCGRIQGQARHHPQLFYGVELALHVYRGLGMQSEHRRTRAGEGFDVVLRLDDNQVPVARLVGELAQRLDHAGAERDVRDEAPVHHVDMQPTGSRLEDLGHLVRQARQVGGQHAWGDAYAVRHCGLRATTISTTVPGAASVPAAGLCATTVPGEPSVVLRRVTVPSCSPSVSSLVRASADAMPSRSGTGIVGAPRLTTMVSPAPGASTVPAGGLVIMASPVGAAGCGSAPPSVTWSLAFWISDCASASVKPSTRGTAWCPGRSGAGNSTRYAVR